MLIGLVSMSIRVPPPVPHNATHTDGFYSGALGEYLLNTNTAASRAELTTVLNGWIASCASKGFQAIEPDNLDMYTRTSLLTQAGNLAVAKTITDYAHSLGLLVCFFATPPRVPVPVVIDQVEC